MTRGDAESVKCPKCKKGIARPADGRLPGLGCMSEFVRNCPHCKTPVRFWVRWAYEVEAEVDSKTV